MTPAPIALFAYNRASHLQRTVEALAANHLARESELYIFSDGPRNAAAEEQVAEVRRYLQSVTGFRSVVITEHARNLGLARSIIEGVTAVCSRHGRVIVLEDDLVTSPWFLTFMNRALTLYEADEIVASVHGYCYPVSEEMPETFFLRGADCWGWGTWQRAWRQFEQDGRKLLAALSESRLGATLDLDGAYGYSRMLADCVAGKNDSWAIRWHVSCFLKGQLTLYPGRSLIDNIGNDASGTHCGITDGYASGLAEEEVRVERVDLAESPLARRAFASFLRGTRSGMLPRAIGRLRGLLGSLGQK